ncbi:MAG: hypothetical protein EOP07_23485 [Proteobacteria bacterium]|nr:MAG: hypothetical protein EOP07_23485 [Pseudomonadota bacterium]
MKRVLVLVLLLAGCAEKKTDSKELTASESEAVCSSRTEQTCKDDVCHPVMGVNATSLLKEYVGCTAAEVCDQAITCATPKGYATPRFVLSNSCMPLSYEGSQCGASDMEALEDYYKSESGTAQ